MPNSHLEASINKNAAQENMASVSSTSQETLSTDADKISASGYILGAKTSRLLESDGPDILRIVAMAQWSDCFDHCCERIVLP